MTIKTLSRLPGLTNPNNPLFNLLTVVTPEHIAELDAEIAVTEAYLQRLQTLRDCVGDPADDATKPEPWHTSNHTVEAPKQLPAKTSNTAETREDAIDRREREEREEEAEDAELVQVVNKPNNKPNNKPSSKPVKPVGVSSSVSQDEKRKEALKYLRDNGFATAGQVMRDINTGPRWIGAILNHKWFESFAQDGKLTWRLSIDGRNALKSGV